MSKFKGQFVIKHKVEELYLGKDEENFMLTSSDSRFILKFNDIRKATKYFRSANHKFPYIKVLFEIETLTL